MSQTTAAARDALLAAFPYTIPIFAGFSFLGMAYGIYMGAEGFSPIYPMLMSLLIFAGSVEFLTVPLLLAPFSPLHAFALAFIVNARHLFYAISMLDRYRGHGAKTPYLIYGMCDESFSINYTAKVPEGIDRGWFFFWVTLLNHLYWFGGATVGALFGSLLSFDTKGLGFVLTAMFVTIFTENWLVSDDHRSALIGLALSFLALRIFGAESFLIPAMAALLAAFTLFRKRLDTPAARQEDAALYPLPRTHASHIRLFAPRRLLPAPRRYCLRLARAPRMDRRCGNDPSPSRAAPDAALNWRRNASLYVSRATSFLLRSLKEPRIPCSAPYRFSLYPHNNPQMWITIGEIERCGIFFPVFLPNLDFVYTVGKKYSHFCGSCG